MSYIKLYKGDNRQILPTLPDNSVDSIITDPPYGLSDEPNMVEVLTHWLNGEYYEHNSNGFMGKSWDSFVPGPDIWKECFRVLKPGGYLLSFFGSRTYDIGTLAIRLAGFEIRDQIMWIYGSGFPKSHNLKDEHKGKGTALKPAHEPIAVARKPLQGTTLANVNAWGTGALNIDISRIPFEDDKDISAATWGRGTNIIGGNYVGATHPSGKTNIEADPLGRWPANVIHDGSEEVLEAFASFGEKKSGKPVGVRKANPTTLVYGKESRSEGTPITGYGDKGSAARFFYCAKADREERDKGCRLLPDKSGGDGFRYVRPAHDPP